MVTAALGALAAAPLGACSSKSNAPAGVATPAPSVLVGVSLPLTGAFAGVGRPLRNAVLVAAAQINAAGGVLRTPVAFDVVDDASDMAQAAVVVDQLVNGGAVGLLGPLASSQVLHVQGGLLQRRLVEITSWASSPLLLAAQPARDRYLFMTVPPDSLQGRVMARLMYDGVPRGADAGVSAGGCRRASFVSTTDAYGSALAAITRADFTSRAGTEIATEDTIAIELAQDYRALAAKIVAAHPDCLALIGHAETGAQVQRDLRSAIRSSPADWSRFFVVASDAQYDPDYLQRGQNDPADPRSENAVEGTYGQVADTTPDNADYHAFEALYNTQFPGKDPAPFAANQFDAAILLALAIERAGTSSDGEKIRDALFDVSREGLAFGPASFVDAVLAIHRGVDIDYRGASGNVDFDDQGGVITDYVIWHVERTADGKVAFATAGHVSGAELK